MLAGVAASTSDIVVFLDADVLNTTADYVARLIQPLLERTAIELVKGFYVRPLHNMPTGGGRVNELTARPILSLLYPGLGEIRQPFAGETAVRRSALETMTLEPDYRVEIALLIDCAKTLWRARDCPSRSRHSSSPESSTRRAATDGGRRVARRARALQSRHAETRLSYFGAESLPRITMTSSPDAPETGLSVPSGWIAD